MAVSGNYFVVAKERDEFQAEAEAWKAKYHELEARTSGVGSSSGERNASREQERSILSGRFVIAFNGLVEFYNGLLSKVKNDGAELLSNALFRYGGQLLPKIYIHNDKYVVFENLDDSRDSKELTSDEIIVRLVEYMTFIEGALPDAKEVFIFAGEQSSSDSLHRLRNDKRDLNKQLEEAKKANETLAQKNADARLDAKMKHDVAVKALKATIADLRKELSTKDKSCLDHIQLVTSEHAITVKCRGELATMRADLERVKNKNKDLSAELKETTDRLHRAEGFNVQPLKRTIETLEREKAELIGRVEELTEAMSKGTEGKILARDFNKRTLGIKSRADTKIEAAVKTADEQQKVAARLPKAKAHARAWKAATVSMKRRLDEYLGAEYVAVVCKGFKRPKYERLDSDDSGFSDSGFSDEDRNQSSTDEEEAASPV